MNPLQFKHCNTLKNPKTNKPMPEVNNGQDEAHNARQCRSEIKIMPVRQLALNTHTHTHTHTHKSNEAYR